MPAIRKRSRLKTYAIALPIFLLLTIILGSIAQFGGEMYRDSFREEGFAIGANWAYPLGWQEGLEAGVAAGRLNGFMEGYRSGVFAWDDKYHTAALQFEERFPWLDVTILVGNENMVGVAILIPDTAPPIKDSEVFNDVLVAMLESVYDGQPIIRLFIIEYIPQYNQLFVTIAIDFFADEFFEYRLGEGTDGNYLIYSPIPCPEFLLEWPTNPYWVPVSEQNGGGGGETNPQ